MSRTQLGPEYSLVQLTEPAWADRLAREAAAAHPEPTVSLTLRIENAYDLYDDEERTVDATVPLPEDPDDEDWSYDNIFALTGSESGEKTAGDAWYDVTVVASSHPDVVPVGHTWDWGY